MTRRRSNWSERSFPRKQPLQNKLADHEMSDHYFFRILLQRTCTPILTSELWSDQTIQMVWHSILLHFYIIFDFSRIWKDGVLMLAYRRRSYFNVESKTSPIGKIKHISPYVYRRAWCFLLRQKIVCDETILSQPSFDWEKLNRLRERSICSNIFWDFFRRCVLHRFMNVMVETGGLLSRCI